MEGSSLDSGYIKHIRERILLAEGGAIFAISDFTDITDLAIVRQSLNRLVQTGVLHRVLRGIFEKPKYSSVLNEFVEISPDAVAKTLVRTYHCSTMPYGNTALYLLGLFSEEPTVWFYISNEPYKTYECNSAKLEFKHRINKEFIQRCFN